MLSDGLGDEGGGDEKTDPCDGESCPSFKEGATGHHKPECPEGLGGDGDQHVGAKGNPCQAQEVVRGDRAELNFHFLLMPEAIDPSGQKFLLPGFFLPPGSEPFHPG